MVNQRVFQHYRNTKGLLNHTEPNGLSSVPINMRYTLYWTQKGLFSIPGHRGINHTEPKYQRRRGVTHAETKQSFRHSHQYEVRAILNPQKGCSAFPVIEVLNHTEPNDLSALPFVKVSHHTEPNGTSMNNCTKVVSIINQTSQMSLKFICSECSFSFAFML